MKRRKGEFKRILIFFGGNVPKWVSVGHLPRSFAPNILSGAKAHVEKQVDYFSGEPLRHPKSSASRLFP
jgi:hypothetical protein